MGLPCGENLVILASTVFVWSTRVTDRQTDRRTERRTDGRATAYRPTRYSIYAVARKNEVRKAIGPESGPSLAKESCKSTELKRWIRTEMRWKRNEVSLSSPDDSRILLPRLDYYYLEPHSVLANLNVHFPLLFRSSCTDAQTNRLMQMIIAKSKCFCDQWSGNINAFHNSHLRS